MIRTVENGEGLNGRWDVERVRAVRMEGDSISRAGCCNRGEIDEAATSHRVSVVSSINGNGAAIMASRDLSIAVAIKGLFRGDRFVF